VDDPAIVPLLRRGDSGALALISAQYRARLVETARRILRDPGEAEDVAQDVLMRVSRMKEIPNAFALRPYLESAARRLAIDRLRKRDLDARASQGAARRESIEGGGDSSTRSDEQARALRELKHLRDPYRAAVTMRYLQGLGFAEIAARLGTNERTARTWVGRGLSKLRHRVEGWK
jgi:RNA polymerase sigma-70 factor, ECF subfamily